MVGTFTSGLSVDDQVITLRDYNQELIYPPVKTPFTTENCNKIPTIIRKRFCSLIANRRQNKQYNSRKNLVKIPKQNQAFQRPHPVSDSQTIADENCHIQRQRSKSRIKMLHLNVRSLKNRTHLLQIRELTRVHRPGVLAISESWLNSTVCNAEVEIDGYKLFRLDRFHKAGGGVCAYIHTDIKCQKLNNLTRTSENQYQQLWLRLQLKKCKSLVICVAYRPPDCPLHSFVSSFKPAYMEALLLKHPIIVMGDLNCNLLNKNMNSQTLNDLCEELNLTQTIESPTRVTATSESLIDVILVSDSSLTKSSGVIKTLISDHYPVFISLKLKMEKLPAQSATIRSFRHYDPESFAAEMAQHSRFLSTLSNQPLDVNNQLNIFNHIFESVLDNHAPIKNIKIKSRSTPFVDEEMKAAIRKRDYLHRYYFRTRNWTDWLNYRNARNAVKLKLRQREKQYVSEQISKSKNNPGALWKVINQTLPRVEKSKAAYTKDTQKLAEEFNSYFSTVGENTAQMVKQLANNYNIPTYITKNILSCTTECQRIPPFDFTAASEEQIKCIILSMPNNRSPGPDKISMRVIKDSLPHILTPLTGLINHSLLSSVYPEAWKLAEIIPILKEGDHEQAPNNRPISLLSIFSKICEKVVLNQYSEYLQRYKILSVHQSGNKRNHSTETLNTYITDNILKAMDEKKITALILIDLSKAFDSICHKTLLQKLKATGISPAVLKWFESFLTERKQYVKVGQSKSTLLSITHGVPQGSILSPLLFSIYTNDLPSITTNTSLDSYVDDSKISLSFSICDKLQAKLELEEDLNNIAAWCCSNSLLPNPDKTKLLLFGTPQLLNTLCEEFTLNFLGKVLHPIAMAKDLGVTLDSYLKYDIHVNELVSSCLSSLSQINRVRHLLDRETLSYIIHSLVLSKLFYCSTVWGNTTAKNVAKLQSVQNFAARIITNTRKFDHITPVLKELKWLPVDKHLMYRDILQVYKCLKGLSPSYLSDQFIYRTSIHQYPTRQNNEVIVPKCRTSTGQRSFHYRAAKLWNSLDEHLQNTSNFKKFKIDLKNYLLDI